MNSQECVSFKQYAVTINISINEFHHHKPLRNGFFWTLQSMGEISRVKLVKHGFSHFEST